MKSQAELRTLEVEGNNGGSYVRVTEVREGMVRLEVGETCVVTVDQEISVAALAAILTHARDRGFQAVLDEYCGRGGGTPALRVDEDPAVALREARFSFVGREVVNGSIGGVNFGPVLQCLVRGPRSALFWSGGSTNPSGMGRERDPAHLIAYARGGGDRRLDFRRVGAEGGRLSARRLRSCAEDVAGLFDRAVAERVHLAEPGRTLLVDGGGEPFRPRRRPPPRDGACRHGWSLRSHDVCPRCAAEAEEDLGP